MYYDLYLMWQRQLLSRHPKIVVRALRQRMFQFLIPRMLHCLFGWAIVLALFGQSFVDRKAFHKGWQPLHGCIHLLCIFQNMIWKIAHIFLSTGSLPNRIHTFPCSSLSWYRPDTTLWKMRILYSRYGRLHFFTHDDQSTFDYTVTAMVMELWNSV